MVVDVCVAKMTAMESIPAVRQSDSEEAVHASSSSDSVGAAGKVRDTPHARYFSSLDGPKYLLVEEADGSRAPIPVEEVTDMLRIALRCVYEQVKNLGRVSVVVTQAKQDVWHQRQDAANLPKTHLEEHQWITLGIGVDQVVMSNACNGVCRHQPIPGKVLRIPDVAADERTADSWYTRNGLRAYCGMRLTCMTECTLCVLWLVDRPEGSALTEAELVLKDCMANVNNIISKLVLGVTHAKRLAKAESKLNEQERQTKYVSHEITNQLVPLMTLNNVDGDIDRDYLADSLEVVVSILKDPCEVALRLERKLTFVNVKEWYEGLVWFAKQMVKKENVKFVSAYEADGSADTEIKIDSNKLRQVVVNLLKNANKFTESGSIDWTMRLKHHATSEEVEVTIVVSDTGCGIATDDLTRVSEMFVQVGIQNKDDPGIGMGLAVSKTIIEDVHKGSFTITSQVGQGTTVTSTFWCACRR